MTYPIISGISCATPERLGAQDRCHFFDEALPRPNSSAAVPADDQSAGIDRCLGCLVFAGAGQFADKRVRGGDTV